MKVNATRKERTARMQTCCDHPAPSDLFRHSFAFGHPVKLATPSSGVDFRQPGAAPCSTSRSLNGSGMRAECGQAALYGRMLSPRWRTPPPRPLSAAKPLPEAFPFGHENASPGRGCIHSTTRTIFWCIDNYPMVYASDDSLISPLSRKQP